MADLSPSASFKQDFQQRLERFCTRFENDEIANWKLASVSFSKPNIGEVVFSHITAPVARSFRFSPQAELPVEEQRSHIRQACLDKGFIVRTEQRLSSEVIKKAKQGDPEAWQSFIERHQDKLTQSADKLLNHGKNNRALQDSDDIANRAFFTMFLAASRGKLNGRYHLQPLLNRRILHEAGIALHARHGRESDSSRITDRAQVEYDGYFERLGQQLPEIVEETKRFLSPRQRDILTGLIEGQKLEDIGEKHQITRERVRQIKAKQIIPQLRRVAHRLAEKNPDFEETAMLIDRLAAKPEKSR